ncbi:MAG: DUF87 domain-containing protein [Candidatus Caldarchaeales archaeon]
MPRAEQGTSGEVLRAEGLSLRSVLGRRVLIVGEAGSGKSRLLARLVVEALASGMGTQVTVIDMAPERTGGFGGKLREIDPQVLRARYLTPEGIVGPRLTGRDAEEVLSFARRNAELIEPLLLEYLSSPTSLLFVNDVTVYLHAGDPEVLTRAVEASRTFVGTAYEGARLSDDKGSGLTAVERERLRALKARVDEVFRL